MLGAADAAACCLPCTETPKDPGNILAAVVDVDVRVIAVSSS